MAVEAGGVRSAGVRRGAVPRACEGKVDGVHRRLFGQKPHAVLDVPLVEGKALGSNLLDLLENI